MFPFGWNYARGTRAHLFLNISLLGRIIMLIIDELIIILPRSEIFKKR